MSLVTAWGILKNPLVGPTRKSQLMVAAAMRREPGSFVKKSSRNDPETDLAPPHRVLLSPHRKLHTGGGCRLALSDEALVADGNGGCVTEDEV